MTNPQTVDRNLSQHNRARKLLWPVAVAIFLFTVSYPVNDFAPPPSPPDIGLGMLIVYAGIAAATVGVVFVRVLPWAFRQTVPEELPWHSLSRARCWHLASGPASLLDSRPAARCSAGLESTRRRAEGSREPPSRLVCSVCCSTSTPMRKCSSDTEPNGLASRWSARPVDASNRRVRSWGLQPHDPKHSHGSSQVAYDPPSGFVTWH
jgi:hypothetical protein